MIPIAYQKIIFLDNMTILTNEFIDSFRFCDSPFVLSSYLRYLFPFLLYFITFYGFHDWITAYGPSFDLIPSGNNNKRDEPIFFLMDPYLLFHTRVFSSGEKLAEVSMSIDLLFSFITS